ncbi:MAG: sigma-70 family RNA polymerase sigma factor [Oscillospiraceae bacterium]|jgi:RNA polymerase sporulation-specific sigma factor|nr:sigma-70 family RNA polymerase sigma factor [Oscillospiraceae bacterium]
MENKTAIINAEEHLGLVRLCANRFRGRGIEYDDLYSSGCIGLLKAVKAFDTQRGVKFSTYAVPVILGEIKRMFRDGGAIKVSRQLKELSLRITRVRDEYTKEYGYDPSVSELSKKLDVSEDEIAAAIAAAIPPMSLTALSEMDEHSEIDIPTESPDIEISDIIALRQVMDRLDKTDRTLIYLRYYKSQTQSQTAEVLGMSQVQVSRREKKILEYMRREML